MAKRFLKLPKDVKLKLEKGEAPTLKHFYKELEERQSIEERLSSRQLLINLKFKFFERKHDNNESVLIFFATDPAKTNDDLVFDFGIPLIAKTDVNDPTIGYLNCQFVVHEMQPLYIIIKFLNALSVQSAQAFEGNIINVDFTDPNQIKGGSDSLIDNNSIPVGNLTADRWIDILDFGQFVSRAGMYDCRCDLNNDGAPIGELDFLIIQHCFLKGSSVEIPLAL